MKLLLYCTKQSHELYATDKGYVITDFKLGDYYKTKEKLNGKIIAECDFEVEEVFRDFIDGKDYTIHPDGVWIKSYYFKTKTLYANELYNKCCLTFEQMYKYFDNIDDKIVGYAIHIKNLHIFDEPIKLEKCHNDDFSSVVNYAPQNMMYAWLYNDKWTRYVLISIKPEWLFKILNGEKTIEVRKKVLSEMK